MTWKCPHCKKPFSHVDALLGHVQKEHKAEAEAVAKGKPGKGRKS